jgi:transcriptional regulator
MVRLTPENQKDLLRIGFNYRFSDDESYLYEIEHTHDYYEYCFVASGKIAHVCNRQKTTMNKGDLVFIRPEDVHRLGRIEGQHFEYINVGVTREEMQRVFQYFGKPLEDRLLPSRMPPVVNLGGDELQRLTSKHQPLFFEFSNSGSNVEKLNIRMRSILTEVMSCFLFSADQEPEQDSKKWLDQVLQQMNSPSNISRGMEALVEISGFSQGHLCRLMKAYYGVTPVAYIIDLRLNYAADLLRGMDMSVNEIARKVGYYSISHFLRSFKEKFGTTPLKYSKLPGADKRKTDEGAVKDGVESNADGE